MKELKDLEKYVIQPNMTPYGGYVHTGENIKLCEDEDVDYETQENENGEKIEVEIEKTFVKQVIIDNKLITDIKTKYMMRNGKWCEEETHQEIELEEKQLLIYKKGNGFVIPEYRMYKAEDAIKLYTNALR